MYNFDYLKERPETRTVTETRMEITKAQNVLHEVKNKLERIANQPYNPLGIDIVARACRDNSKAESTILIANARLKELREKEKNMYDASDQIIDNILIPKLESIMKDIDTMLGVLDNTKNPILQNFEDNLENIKEVLEGGMPEDWI